MVAGTNTHTDLDERVSVGVRVRVGVAVRVRVSVAVRVGVKLKKNIVFTAPRDIW